MHPKTQTSKILSLKSKSNKIEIAKVEIEKVSVVGGWCSEILMLSTSQAQFILIIN